MLYIIFEGDKEMYIPVVAALILVGAMFFAYSGIDASISSLARKGKLTVRNRMIVVCLHCFLRIILLGLPLFVLLGDYNYLIQKVLVEGIIDGFWETTYMWYFVFSVAVSSSGIVFVLVTVLKYIILPFLVRQGYWVQQRIAKRKNNCKNGKS